MTDIHLPTLHTASRPRQVTDGNNNLSWENSFKLYIIAIIKSQNFISKVPLTYVQKVWKTSENSRYIHRSCFFSDLDVKRKASKIWNKNSHVYVHAGQQWRIGKNVKYMY
jgi:hypothetical protein